MDREEESIKMFPYQTIHEIENRDIPDFLQEFIHVKEFQRLKDVGMSCGLEYTSFPFFQDQFRYTRYDHSIGVALLLSRFTEDKNIIIAGLYHDIATPCFAHVVDFLNQDYETQESTESLTGKIIHESDEISSLLDKYGMQEENINDYHKYPLADNDRPKLSADRLEYNLGNAVQYHNLSFAQLEGIVKDLVVLENEEKEKEIGFENLDEALLFTSCSLFNSGVYTQAEDRYSMERLALILKDAIQRVVIRYEDLYLNESFLISKLLKDEISADGFNRFEGLSRMRVSKEKKDGYLKIKAKKRYVNPLVKNRGRVLDLSKELRQRTDAFLREDFEEYLCGNDVF